MQQVQDPPSVTSVPIPAQPTQPVIVQQNQPMDYTMGMTPTMRAFAQGGFAVLAAILLMMMYRDISRDSKDMRDMYRDESDRNRVELRVISEAADRRNDSADKRNADIAARLTTLTYELQRTADVLRSAGIKLGQIVPEKPGDLPELEVTAPTLPAPRPKTVAGLLRRTTGPGDNP